MAGQQLGEGLGDWSPSTLGRRRVGFTPDVESVLMQGQHTHVDKERWVRLIESFLQEFSSSSHRGGDLVGGSCKQRKSCGVVEVE